MEILQSTPLSDYYQSIKRWTSEEVKYRLPTWVTLLGMGIILILLISIVIALLFEKQVRKRTAELREINREMENRIIDRTAELSVAMQKAQQADILKSAFLATMSHELRTPLNSIIGFTGILMKQIPGKLNEEQTKQLGLVQKSSRHLLTLINDILDISKIEAGQLELNCQEFRLEETLSKVASLVQPQVDKKHLELVVDVLDKPCPINTDQRRFEQVLLNLLSNAIKFTETGRITLSCKIVKGLYRVTVQDTGIGIPASEHANLFQPFHQIDSGLTRKYDGTGLGLSITFNLIKMMGGNLTLESEAGKGSSFSFALPVPNEELT